MKKFISDVHNLFPTSIGIVGIIPTSTKELSELSSILDSAVEMSKIP